jgi:hypothetical protein
VPFAKGGLLRSEVDQVPFFTLDFPELILPSRCQIKVWRAETAGRNSLMNLLSHSWDVRMLWFILPLQAKLFFLCLLLATTYMIFSIAFAYRRGRSFAPNGTEPFLRSLHPRFLRRMHNLRQLHFTFLLIFGVIMTDELFRALQAYERSKLALSESTAAQIADPVLAFAYCCLLIFTFLQILQWLVSIYLEKIAAISQ